MSGYIGNIPTPQATQTRDTFTATSGQTTFATSGYTPNFVLVWLNGVLLQEGTDYTASNGSDVVLTTGAAADDIVEVVAYSTFQLADQTFTGDFSVDSPTFVVDSTNDRVGIGTSSPTAALDVRRSDTDGKIAEFHQSSGYGLDISSSTSIAKITSGYNQAFVFETGATPTERMRLTPSGYLLLGTTSPTAGTHPTLTVHGDATRVTFELYRPSSSGGNDLQTWRSDIGGTGTKVADVEANGDFNSATGNYATLSDERLKQDITPANSQWDDIKALEFKNYRMINLVETMGDDAPVYFGVIAQQLEAAGMNGLVEDKVDDDTQEVTKVVKTSILQMKAVKALQEAMERIEALEAEVAALKGGAA